MDEDLEFDIGYCLVDGTNLVDSKFAGQNHPTKAQVTQPTDLIGRAVVGLGGSVKVEG